MEKIRVLFLAANPPVKNLLKLDEEIRAINEKIRSSEYRDSLTIISVWAVRPDDMLQSLNEHKPQIVHFSGHGSKTGEIILIDKSGQPKPISAEAIKALFKVLKDNVRLVVLNACYSKIQAEAIREIIDCVVGMESAIGDNAALTFSASFYRAIGFGKSVQAAYEQGKVALLLEGISGAATPDLLYKKGVDPNQVYLISPRKEKIASDLEVTSLVLAALTAGAAATAGDTSSQTIKDTYTGLKTLILNYFTDMTEAETALAQYEMKPDSWKEPLKDALVETDAYKDEEIILQARLLLGLVKPQEAAQTKYNVQIREGKGIVIGDNAQVTQNIDDN